MARTCPSHPPTRLTNLRRRQRIQKHEQVRAINVVEVRELLRRGRCFASVQGDRLLNRPGATIVKVRRRIAHSPEWGRPPFAKRTRGNTGKRRAAPPVGRKTT